VEDTIGDLLERVPALLSEAERPKYVAALEQVRKTTVTQTKIELVKELLPARLRRSSAERHRLPDHRARQGR
jgi:hypothetical protein